MAIEITDTEIKYDAWVKRGCLQVRREHLSPEDPEQLYNYLKANGVEKPEIYGIYHPVLHDIEEKYEGYERKELISVIAKMTMEMKNMECNFEQWR